MANTTVAYAVLGVYIIAVLVAGLFGAFLTFKHRKNDLVQEHFMAGKGLHHFTWFFTMSATLFSGYSVSGIVNEAFTQGWVVTRWIMAGVGIYAAFGIMAPRLHALGKSRHYFNTPEFVFDRYLPANNKRRWVAHCLGLLAFACLQLPIFTYLITQFQSIGIEVRTFTGGAITPLTSVLVAAAVLLICDLLGGMRAVAFTDVLQGVVLFFGSIIFLIIQKTELGGLETAHNYWANPALPQKGSIFLMQHIPPRQTIVAYFDFVFKTTIAATMFPHLTARLFAARNADVMRHGMATMNFTFFVVQLSSMITGWVAISALVGVIKPGQSAFGASLLLVAERGTGQAVASALLLASAICAMMSTADSALLAFSAMWVRDLYVKYIRKKAGAFEQLLFGKIVAVCGLVIGVTLALYTIEKGKPDLSSLFSLQNVTPIHVAPSVWLGLHWRGLRGEAVLIGWVCGLATTLGICFSDANIKLKLGSSDLTKSGLSSALIGCFVNFGLTILLGWAFQYGPYLLARLRGRAYATSADEETTTDVAIADTAEFTTAKLDEALDESSEDAVPEPGQRGTPLDIGPVRSRTLQPWLWLFMFLVLLFTIPFYRIPNSHDKYISAMATWAFTSLLLAGVLAITSCYMHLYLWEDYVPWSKGVSKVQVQVVTGDLPRGTATEAADGQMVIQAPPTAARAEPIKG